MKTFVGKCIDVSLTTDIWTDWHSDAFLAVIAHAFLNGKPVCAFLSFQAFAGSHTGEGRGPY